MNKKTKVGFTLIELLVVVLIIGILAAVALPQYKLAVTKSKFRQLQLFVEDVARAQEEIFLATGAYTIDIDQLSITIPAPNSVDKTTVGRATVYYPWGYCTLQATTVSCDSPAISMYYQNYYPNSASKSAGRRECGVLDLSNQTAFSICKQETKKDPFLTTTSYASFAY